MQIAVLGAGAMGCWFGGQLALAGSDVQLLTTNQANRDAINSEGLTLVGPTQQSNISLPARSPEQAVGPVDLVLLFTKSFQSGAALTSARHILSDSTWVLSLQNGLGNAQTIEQFVPAERILIGNSLMPVDAVSPGVVSAKGAGPSYFNALLKVDDPSRSTVVNDIHNTFSATGMDVQLDPDIHARIWNKVAFNAGMNALCALTHGTPGTIGAVAGAQQLAKDCADEVIAVAKSQGVVVDREQVYSTIEFACREHGDHKASMLQDLLARRTTEVDALNGMIVHLGEGAGLPVPLNRIFTTLLKLAEHSYQKYG